jgi:hypothetical protein
MSKESRRRRRRREDPRMKPPETEKPETGNGKRECLIGYCQGNREM